MSGAPVVKLHPTCAVRGVLQVGARFGVCGQYVVGGKCGKSGACSHKQEPDLCGMTVAELAELVRRDWGTKIDEHYAKSVKRKHFTFSGLKIPKGSRVFAIDIAGEFDLPKAAALLNKIGTLFSHKEHKRTLESERFCPYIILNGIQDTDMATLKAALYRQGIFFEDGHPFLGSDFYPARLTTPLTPGFPIKLKFIPSAEHLAPSFAGVHGTSIEVFDFFKTSPLDRRFRLPDAVHNEIQIPHTYFISEILKS